MSQLFGAVRSRSLSRPRIASGLFTLALALGLVGTQLAAGLTAEGASPAITSAPAPPSGPAQVVWKADMETGNLGEWTAGGTRGGSYDSGDCLRPSNGVTTEQAHSGRFSMKMTIDTSKGQSGCRQFRHEESARGGEYFYSAWMMIPKQVNVSSFWNIFQFKSSNSSINETTWVVEAKSRPNGNLHAVLRWKGLVAGPYSGDGTALRYYDQAVKDFPIGEWFHLEVFLRQSESYSGRVTVWQDGVQLWDMNNVKTRYPNADQRWSINSYSDRLSGNAGTIYVDDARISRNRVGPN